MIGLPESYLHVAPGRRIAFSRFPSFDGDWVDAVADDMVGVVAALRPVARPLAVDFWLDSRTTELPFIATSVEPSRKAWHIREREIPDRVEVPSYVGPEIERSTVSELTPDALRARLSTAIAQRPPEADHAVTVSGLAARTLRARVLDEDWPEDGVVIVRDGPARLEMPLERRSDGLWVTAPLRGYSIEPPVSFEIHLDEGVLRASVTVMWSRWSQPGTPEHGGLEEALTRLASAGWQVDAVPETFDLGQPSAREG